MNDFINEPDASRLITGLRDTGYSFKTAIADIVDNSIAANATEIHINIEMTHEGRKYVYIGDNGDGMNPEGVYSAMKYGAPARPDAASLGKFGLGLKTASSSICKNYALISRQTGNEQLYKLSWDLDHVESQNRWEMLHVPIEKHEKEEFERCCGEKGTLVVWSKCDRILNKSYSNPGGSKEQAAIKRLRSTLVEHIALVYNRFLNEEDSRERLITIFVNGERVTGWDPFFKEKSQQVLAPNKQEIKIELDEYVDYVCAKIRAFILPHKNELSEEERYKAKISNKRQGFYIYREGRLISEGGWLGLFMSEPHTSLLRVEFDFDHRLDEAFTVDVKKSRVSFDPAIEEVLIEILGPIRREADKRYRGSQKSKIANNLIDHQASNNSISVTPTTKKPVVEVADEDTQTVVISNDRGVGIKIHQPVHNNIDPSNIYVNAVNTITNGNLWMPVFQSPSSTDHVPGVEINKHHDFYQKIYQRAKSNGYSVQGIDLLLWAIAVAELNYSDDEMVPIFEDFREFVSSNLRKLLRDIDLPDDSELNSDTDFDLDAF